MNRARCRDDAHAGMSRRRDTGPNRDSRQPKRRWRSSATSAWRHRAMRSNATRGRSSTASAWPVPDCRPVAGGSPERPAGRFHAGRRHPGSADRQRRSSGPRKRIHEQDQGRLIALTRLDGRTAATVPSMPRLCAYRLAPESGTDARRNACRQHRSTHLHEDADPGDATQTDADQ